MGELHSGTVSLAACGSCGCRVWFLELDPARPGVVVGTICASEECNVVVPLLGYVVDMAKEH